MATLLCLDTNLYRYLGNSSGTTVPGWILDRLVLSPITIWELASQVCVRNQTVQRQNIQLLRQLATLGPSRLLPDTTEFLRAIVFPYVWMNRVHDKWVANFLGACAAASDANLVGLADHYKVAIDNDKQRLLTEFSATIEQFRTEGLPSADELRRTFGKVMARRTGLHMAGGEESFYEIAEKQLRPYFVYRTDLTLKATKDRNYRFDKPRNLNSFYDGEQLCLLKKSGFQKINWK